MKNKKLIFIGIGLVGAYLLYKKHNQNKRAGSYSNKTSCENAGFTWGYPKTTDEFGMPRPSSTLICH